MCGGNGMRAVLKVTLAAALGIVLTGCGDSAQPRVERKKPQVERMGVSAKADLGITVTEPDSWHRLSDRDAETVMDRGVDMAVGDDPALQRAMESARNRALAIFAVFEHPPGAPVAFNPSVLANAENITGLPGIQRGADYFFHVRRTLSASGLSYEIVAEPAPYAIDGQSFDRAELQININGIDVKQAIYLARHGDYMVSIVQSWSSDEQKAATQAVLDSIKLDW